MLTNTEQDNTKSIVMDYYDYYAQAIAKKVTPRPLQHEYKDYKDPGFSIGTKNDSSEKYVGNGCIDGYDDEYCDDEYCDDEYCDDEYCDDEYCDDEYCDDEYCDECDDEYCDECEDEYCDECHEKYCDECHNGCNDDCCDRCDSDCCKECDNDCDGECCDECCYRRSCYESSYDDGSCHSL
ncbi:hypothetical protein COCC4DRAFT_64935 [Bipolaris maydis ATCC 48331]|uniref:Uncharacterized protein n=1 Tax=Cochliobolus heterostrophus (strain C4 / ATCC 48331 / race T) TaxID=665024 RepID=N4WY43_COCH4|nr:uncharacterized protein COCC4DRAFT_64935 [Bipolaris maydis ATCC 48331]ENI01108.1 hypothetical protein COCC4DRAFT_64935 [Bipolaris maydis ATCC 48331]